MKAVRDSIAGMGKVTVISAPPSLWRHRDFTVYWAGETTSLFGSQVTFIALPLVAILVLDASTAELGVLRFAEYLPFLLFTLFFGVWADRRRRRPLMIWTNLIRALLVALVPLSAMLGLLRIPELVVIAFAAGTCTAMYEVCWLSYVPSLVRRTQLIDAMGKVSASHSAAETAGPAVGGALVQVLTAPFALAVDAISYLVGAGSLLVVRQREPNRVVTGTTPRRVLPELVEGLTFTFGQPCIRATAFCAALGNFFSLITETAFLPYAVRELHLAPALVGLTLSAMGIGGLIGAVMAYRIINRFALGRVYVVARSVSAAGTLLLPLATGSKVETVSVCMASFFVWQAALASTNVINSSLRQALTPENLRGRMNASVRTLVFGALPLGGLAGGLLGSYLGLHNTLWIGAAGFATSLVPILLSPVPRLRSLPD